MARDGIYVNDFSGGLNNVADASIIADNELAEVTNLVLSKGGKLISRPPFQPISDYPAGGGVTRMLGYYRNEDGIVFLVVANDTKTYIYSIVAATWTEIWAYPAADMTTYLNRLYLVRTSGAGGYWSKVSGVYSFTTLAAMPKGNQIHATKGRIYISSRELTNTSTIRYSNITSISGGTSIDEFPANNFIDVNEGDGQLLVKILEGNNELFLFRSNSTWRLAFGASAEPTDGTLSPLSQTVGVDGPNCAVEAGNIIAVLHAGTLYQFAGYNFYPLNDYNKVQFFADTAEWDIPAAVSKVGQYLIVWYHGSTYCFDTEAGAWTEWKSDTNVAHLLEAPRGTLLTAIDAVRAYGTPASITPDAALIRFSQEYNYTDMEVIRCSVKTKVYDIDQPSKFKRMFGWEALGVFVNYLQAAVVPIQSTAEQQITWSQLGLKTWSQAETEGIVWATGDATIPVVVTGIPSQYPIPQIIKISGKQVFKRAFFHFNFENDGNKTTSPSRFDGFVMYLTNGRRAAIERTA